MSVKKILKNTIITTGAITLAIHLVNQYIAAISQDEQDGTRKQHKYYDWTYGEIYYEVSGSGSPVILLHDLSPSSCSYEWSEAIGDLSGRHTVYALDLPGCGRSSHPKLIYTNFLYVQMLCSFIEDVIGEKASVIATGLSSSVLIPASVYKNELFEKLTLINPPSLDTLAQVPTPTSRAKKLLAELPVYGTALYNYKYSKSSILSSLQEDLVNEHVPHDQYAEKFWKSAHQSGADGKYLLSSIMGNYIYMNLTPTLEKLTTPTTILCGSSFCNSNAEEYADAAPSIEIKKIANAGLYPHIDNPVEFLKAL